MGGRETMACRAILAVLLGVATLFIGSPAIRAAEIEAAPEPGATPLPPGPNVLPVDEPWRPPVYVPSEKDWLRLNSGEWVRGTIERINDENVYFDSVELEDLEIDWSDVAELRSAKQNTYRFTREGGKDIIVTGTAGMRDGILRIDTGAGIRSFPRDDLLSMIEGELREINYWSLDGSLGMTLRSGNSNEFGYSLRAKLMRETPLSRGFVLYESAYSVAENVRLTDNQRLYGEFAIYVSKRFFAQVPTAEAYQDHLQNIDLRTTVGAGLGYDVVDRPRMDWRVTLGGGYQRTEFGQVQPTEDNPANDAALMFGTTIELDPWKDIDWDTSYKLAVVVTDLSKTNHHLSSVFSFEIWGPLDLDISFIWDRIEGPARDSAGELPERNDYQMTLGLAIDL